MSEERDPHTEHRDCPFCRVDLEEVIIDNDLVFARFDRFPVSRGHLLIIPKRHFADYFEASRQEKMALMEVIDQAKRFLHNRFCPDGYNIGVNIGEAAGQTVMHLHVHVIPRYTGDVPDPRGGIRGVIAGRQHDGNLVNDQGKA
ncbi:MAG TPA: HIT family protein [Methanoregulaceae archaeon]|nr:HIT family protein [Methanoregulaceae archaeon]